MDVSLLRFLNAVLQDLDALTTLKRAMKGSNAEHYSVRDHGKEGRRREREQQRQEMPQNAESPGCHFAHRAELL